MPTPEPVSRRTALVGLAGVGGVAAAVLAGCTSGRAGPGPTAPTPTSTGTPTRTSTGTPTGPAPDPDVALAAETLVVEQAMLDRVLATQRRHPRLTGPLAASRAAHRAHVDLLGTAVTDCAEAAPTRRTPEVPAAPDAALAALARAEDRIADSGRRSALAAESGAFARVLASMAAAAAQLAVVHADAAGARR